jgi:site-specific DNA-methyltransferase (cytosine-N4-specific)
MSKSFTYGDQFSPEKFSILEICNICKNNLDERKKLQDKISKEYFAATGDPSKMAMNTVLSLNAYGLIKLIDNGKKYEMTDLSNHLLELRTLDEANKEFAQHILKNLEGLLLLKIIEDMNVRGEVISLESLAYELNDIGIQIAPNATYISTMKSWLNTINVFVNKKGYEIDWGVVKNLIGFRKDLLDDLYDLNIEQKYYLRALLNLDGRDFLSSNKVAEYVRSVYRLRLTTKNLPKDILEPLADKGLIEFQKTTGGRGAKPHLVKLSPKIITEVFNPILKNISENTGLSLPKLNKKFEEVVQDLDSKNKHTKGVALELLSVWMVRLLGLHFTGWRIRSKDTGGGEVDVLAGNDKIIYNKWQIQCKNTNSTIGFDVISKEVGLTFLTNADIIMIVTTSKFSKDAIFYANKVMRNSRYYLILIDKRDLKAIIKDRTIIVDLLNQKAEKVFFVKEVISKEDSPNV